MSDPVRLITPDLTTQQITAIEKYVRAAIANSVTGLTNAVGDAAAATAGVPVGGLYRNGSILMVRVS